MYYLNVDQVQAGWVSTIYVGFAVAGVTIGLALAAVASPWVEPLLL